MSKKYIYASIFVYIETGMIN